MADASCSLGTTTPLGLLDFGKGFTTGSAFGASGTAALNGALPDAVAAVTVVPRSLGTATSCWCFGGCKGFATGSTLGTFGVATPIGAPLLEPSDAMAVAFAFSGNSDPLRLLWWWWRGLCHSRLIFGNFWGCYNCWSTTRTLR